MSIFDQNNTQTQTPNFLNDLVGDGKKYVNNDELAKGYANASNHITTLTNENASLRSQIEELQKKITSNTNLNEALNQNNTAPVEDKNITPNMNNLTAEELQNLVTNLMTQKEQQTIAQRNIEMVDQYINNMFGEGAEKMVAQKSQELGMGLDTMKQLAQTSPQAVLAMFGNTQPTQTNTSTLTSSFNLQGQQEEVKGHKHYSALQKSDPKTFNSPAMQKEYFAAIEKLGEDFLKC